MSHVPSMLSSKASVDDQDSVCFCLFIVCALFPFQILENLRIAQLNINSLTDTRSEGWFWF